MQINRPEDEQDRIDVAILALAETFDRKPTSALLTGYQLGLQDIPVEAVERAALQAINTMDRMPRPVELRRLAGEMSPEDRAVAAWGVVEQNVYRGRYKHVDFDDGLINATIRNLGGWVTLLDKTGDEFDKWARQDFIRTYQSFLRSGASAEACRPLPGLSDTGDHAVRGTDGKTRTVRLPGPEVIVTGLPPLPESKAPRIGRETSGISKSLKLTLKKPADAGKRND